MIGRQYWIVIWYVILVVGLIGFGAALYWGRATHWKNLDEVFRSMGTVLVSFGMLLLLYSTGVLVGQFLMLAALAAFVLAFVLGRKSPLPHGPPSHDDDDES